MGTSTDAYLFFGIGGLWEDGEDIPWDDEIESDDDFIAKKFGLDPPPGEYNRGAEWNNYFTKKRDLLKKLPCGINIHCSSECPIYFITLKDKYKCAYRGYETTINSEFLEVTEEEIKQLKDFCEKIGVPCENPQWTLVSYWG